MDTSERDTTRDRVAKDSTLWRAEAWAAYCQVEDELHRATAQGDTSSETFKTEATVVRADLDDALAAMVPPEHRKASLKRYYSGSDIGRAWSAIHRAGESLFAVYEGCELYAQAGRLEDLIAALPKSKSLGTVITDVHSRLKEGESSRKAGRASLGKARAMLRQLYREAVGATETLQVEARVLRNTLLVASGALFLVVLVIGIVGLLDPDIFSLCAPAPSGGGNICPIGTDPHRLDVFAVELAGMLGGLLSVVIPLAIGERIKTPYRVFNHQLLLKVVAGAGTALAGIILVQGAFESTLSISSEGMIIGYAVFFGFSQQALTGLIDRRASDLGKETPTTKSV